jgi:hypothetical protein
MRTAEKRLTGLHIYRDGGSLSATFSDAEGSEHTLFLKTAKFLVEEREGREYLAPVLQRHLYTTRVSPITAETSQDYTTETCSSSWEEAQRILSQLESQVAALDTDYRWVFQAMVEAALRKGLVP